MNVYPNPFSTNLDIEVRAVGKGNATITIFEITGKTVISFNSEVKEGINRINADQAASLRTGLYFISVELDGRREVMKLVKE
jgi:hypothetical protein